MAPGRALEPRSTPDLRCRIPGGDALAGGGRRKTPEASDPVNPRGATIARRARCDFMDKQMTVNIGIDANTREEIANGLSRVLE